ncbi:MAG: outer membrane lipoprotein-sorting protein [Planctomycetota bacterium]
MEVLRRAAAGLGAALCLSLAVAAQDRPPPAGPPEDTPSPAPSPIHDSPAPGASPRPTPSAAPVAPAPDDEALRAETARLAAELMTRRTRPTRERARLEVRVLERGSLVERTRVLDVSLARVDGRAQVRVRFREPAALRGQATLVREDPDGRRHAWRWDPARRRVERIAPPQEDERLGGTGLTWADLRGEEPGRWGWRLGGAAQLTLPGGQETREVLQLSARLRSSQRADGRAPAGGLPAGRRLYLDRQLKLPLLIEELDLEGKVQRKTWLARWRRLEGEGDAWRADARSIAVPGSERLSEVKALERSPEVPAFHLDPDRFGQDE